MKKIDVVIPVRNEESNVAKLTDLLSSTLKQVTDKYKLIFVVDPSTDKTTEVLSELASSYPITIHYKQGAPGKGYSLVEGILLSDAELVAFIDGDLQYPAEALIEMAKIMEDETVGVVVANRKKYDSTLVRTLGSRLNKIIFGKLLLGLDCDIQSGLKMFRRHIFDHVDITTIGPWTFDIPLLHTAVKLGYTIGKVDIIYTLRNAGTSKVKFLRTAFSIAGCAVQTAVKPNKVYHLNGHKDVHGEILFKKNKFTPHTLLPHHKSAIYTTIRAQKYAILGLVFSLILGFVIAPLKVAIFLIAVLSVIYFSDVLFSVYLILKSLHFPPEISFTPKQIAEITDEELPIYSVMCPLYKEAHVLPQFVEAMTKMDYPKDKMDVLILLEENDKETIEVAEQMNLPEYFRIIVVPHSMPKTKPKACNYGIHFAKGEYMVVYDAEDVPEITQLKKGYLAFKQVKREVICIQAKLNYYNPNQNLLTTLFTAEYSLWFDVILPGLQSINTIIPLGGTSNHFRTKDLIYLHSWDPFNVTEDCDLGVRLFKDGYKTEIMDSVTLEEANSNVKNWIRQRSRWIKGYLQTYLVHMRDPIEFVKQHKWHALIFQLIIGLRISFILINPILWAATISYFTLYKYVGPTIEALYPTPVFYMAAFSLVFGNFIYLYNYMIGLAKRGHWAIIKYVFLVPFYWAMMGISAIIAFQQLIFKPHFWEKTHHGLHMKKDSTKEEVINEQPKIVKRSFSLPLLKTLEKKSLISGTTLIAAAMASNVIYFLTNAYLGRNLVPEEFGLIALMGSFLFIAQIPAAGIDQTISHQTAYIFGKFGRPLGEIWKKYRPKLLKLSLSLSIVWILLIPISANFFNSTEILPFLIFSPVWAFLLLQAADSGYLQGSHKFHLLALLTFIGALSKLIFSVTIVELGLNRYVYAALPLSLLVTLIVAWNLAKNTATVNSEKLAQDDINKAVNFSKKFFFTAVLTKISSISFLSMDLIFVKHYLSAVEAGQYALLILVGRMVYMVGGLFTQFILPLVSKQEGRGHKNNNAFYLLLSSILLATSGVFVFVGPLGFLTVPLLFGEKTLPIIQYLIPFTFSMILFSLGYSLVIFHQAKKEYIFAVPGITTVLVQATYLLFNHSSINDVVTGMVVSAGYYFIFSVTLHFFKEQAISLVNNLLDLIKIAIPINPSQTVNKDGEGLKILIFNWRDTKHVWAGGAEIYIYELAKHWKKEGHDVTIFCGNDRRNNAYDEVDGIKIIRRGGFYTVYLWAFLYYITKLRGKYDIIIDCENGIPFFTPLYVKEPVVCLVHHVHRDLFFKDLRLPSYLLPAAFIAKQLESVIMPYVYKNTQMITVSESSKKDLEKLGFGKKTKIAIANPGVDLNRYVPGNKSDTPTVVYLGRLKAYKSIHTVIRAIEKAKDEIPNIKLIVAGFGESRSHLEKLTKELKIKDYVEFTGKVSESDKITLLQNAWVFVQPSTMEGWGISVIEANACGTPAIASKVPGLIDSVKNNYSGITVEVNNVEMWTKTITKTLKNKEKMETLSLNARNWSEKFDWTNTATVFMASILSVHKSHLSRNRPISSKIHLKWSKDYE